jgi:hypothetical protein
MRNTLAKHVNIYDDIVCGVVGAHSDGHSKELNDTFRLPNSHKMLRVSSLVVMTRCALRVALICCDTHPNTLSA